MKNTILILSLFFVCNLSAQIEYNFEIQTNPDSTFNLLVIEQLSDDRSKIDKYANMDTTAIQGRLYSDINAAYERIARINRQIDDQVSLRNQLISALNSQGINDYVLNTRERLDSFYMAPSWAYRTAGDTLQVLTPQLMANNLTRLKNQANEPVFLILPNSPNNIKIRFYEANDSGGFQLTDRIVDLYSNDSRVYVGTDADGLRHVFVKRRQ
jgi:hypothetical protein